MNTTKSVFVQQPAIEMIVQDTPLNLYFSFLFNQNWMQVLNQSNNSSINQGISQLVYKNQQSFSSQNQELNKQLTNIVNQQQAQKNQEQEPNVHNVIVEQQNNRIENELIDQQSSSSIKSYSYNKQSSVLEYVSKQGLIGGLSEQNQSLSQKQITSTGDGDSVILQFDDIVGKVTKLQTKSYIFQGHPEQQIKINSGIQLNFCQETDESTLIKIQDLLIQTSLSNISKQNKSQNSQFCPDKSSYNQNQNLCNLQSKKQDQNREQLQQCKNPSLIFDFLSIQLHAQSFHNSLIYLHDECDDDDCDDGISIESFSLINQFQDQIQSTSGSNSSICKSSKYLSKKQRKYSQYNINKCNLSHNKHNNYQSIKIKYPIMKKDLNYQKICYDPEQQRKRKIDKNLIKYFEDLNIDWNILKSKLEKQLHQFDGVHQIIWQKKRCLLDIQSQRRAINSIVILFMEVDGVPMMLLNLFDTNEVYREKLYRLADGEIQLIFNKQFDKDASYIDKIEMVQTIGEGQFRSLFDEERKKIKFSERSYISRMLGRYFDKLKRSFSLSANIVASYLVKSSF